MMSLNVEPFPSHRAAGLISGTYLPPLHVSKQNTPPRESREGGKPYSQERISPSNAARGDLLEKLKMQMKNQPMRHYQNPQQTFQYEEDCQSRPMPSYHSNSMKSPFSTMKAMTSPFGPSLFAMTKSLDSRNSPEKHSYDNYSQHQGQYVCAPSAEKPSPRGTYEQSVAPSKPLSKSIQQGGIVSDFRNYIRETIERSAAASKEAQPLQSATHLKDGLKVRTNPQCQSAPLLPSIAKSASLPPLVKPTPRVPSQANWQDAEEDEYLPPRKNSYVPSLSMVTVPVRQNVSCTDFRAYDPRTQVQMPPSAVSPPLPALSRPIPVCEPAVPAAVHVATQPSIHCPTVTLSLQKAPVKSSDKKRRGLCQVVGCLKMVRSKGLCKAHGGGRRCQYEGCTVSDQGGGFCIAHGGGKRCGFPSCSNAAQSRGFCKSHGGGRRCQVPGCSKSSQGDGKCRSHGGGRKCKFEGCQKGEQRGGYCAAHDYSPPCKFKGCRRTVRVKGYCMKHVLPEIYQELDPATSQESSSPAVSSDESA